MRRRFFSSATLVTLVWLGGPFGVAFVFIFLVMSRRWSDMSELSESVRLFLVVILLL